MPPSKVDDLVDIFAPKRSAAEQAISVLSDSLAGDIISGYKAFQKKYRAHPDRFVRDCIIFPDTPNGKKGGPAKYQINALKLLAKERRIAIRAPRGAGKSALSAWALLWAILVFDDVKVPTTAGAWRQLTKYLWPEVHKWAACLDWEKIGIKPFTKNELLSLSLRVSRTQEAFAVTSSNPDLVEGAQARVKFWIFDESKAIQDGIWDAVEGGLLTDEVYTLAISTPGAKHGRFYDIHRRAPGLEDWYPIHIKIQDLIDAGRTTAARVQQQRLLWGEDSAAFKNYVLAEFASDSMSNNVIPFEWVEKANERWLDLQDDDKLSDGVFVREDLHLGVDVGRGGNDTVLAYRYGNIVRKIERMTTRDTMTVVSRVQRALDSNPGSIAIIDVMGIGAGVVDRLREQSYSIIAYSSSHKSHWRDASGELAFADRRSASYWKMRELLDPQSGNDIALPPDDRLIGDLSTPTWRDVTNGKIRVESKELIAKRIGRSTDYGDAVIMSFEERRTIHIGFV